MDLENLSDIEIRQQLTALGQNVGPVTSTTRAVHLKKLKTLLAMQGDAPLSRPTPPHIGTTTTYSNGTQSNLLEFENEPMLEDEEELTQLRVREPMSEAPRKARTALIRADSQTSSDEGSDGEMGGHESVRYLSPEEMELETTYARSLAGSVSASHTGNLRKVLVAVFVLALVVFIFFLSDRVHRQTANYSADDEL